MASRGRPQHQYCARSCTQGACPQGRRAKLRCARNRGRSRPAKVHSNRLRELLRSRRIRPRLTGIRSGSRAFDRQASATGNGCSGPFASHDQRCAAALAVVERDIDQPVPALSDVADAAQSVTSGL
jgi:hypothetical protein